MDSSQTMFKSLRETSSRRRFLKASGGSLVAASLGGFGVLTPLEVGAAGAVKSRPISDFLAKQGQLPPDGYLYVPPAPNFLGWSTIWAGNTHVLFAGVDYAGLANAFFGNPYGTTMDGMVIERPLADGRAEVRVTLFTDNANAWVIDLDLTGDVLDQIANKPTLFGHRPGIGAPALGQTQLEVRFTNTSMGADLPDLLLMDAAAGQVLEFMGFNCQASGPLTAEFGVAEGTPGRCKIRQTGLIATSMKASPKSRVALDAYPAELIEIRRVGR